MLRIPEPELMDDDLQARAYSEADFSEPHDMFVAQFRQRFPILDEGTQVLDIGCGPADVVVRFAKSFPDCQIDGLDGANSMVQLGEKRIEQAQLQDRINLVQGCLSANNDLYAKYHVILSNSLLHHLADPASLWDTVREKSMGGSLIFMMDLIRPASEGHAKKFVELYAATEPEILQRDFYHSLLASYRPREVIDQLKTAGMEYLQVQTITDRHMIIFGQVPLCS